MKNLLNQFQKSTCRLPFSFITLICLLSCSNQENEYYHSFYKIEYTKEDPIIDFNTMACLNEANQKAIELSSISLRLSEDIETLHLLLKIKRDQKKIRSEFNKLTKDNLIIIPKLTYHLQVDKDSINNAKPDLYILKKLEIEIKNQIASFESIEKNTQNTEFKQFAKKSKEILKDNNKVLRTL